MPNTNSRYKIFLVPSPRTVSDIFDAEDLARLNALGDVVIHEGGEVSEELFDSVAADVSIIIGQIDLPESRLKKAQSLRAIINVEGNFLPNVDYLYCFKAGIRVLNVSPVFAEPVSEVALGMALSLARSISRSDRYFREGTERYGLAANETAFSLYRAEVGFIGMGDLGKAILPLLKPFGVHVKAYDPWLPKEYIESLGCEYATLDEVLQTSKFVFVVAGATSANQGFLGKKQFDSMRPGSALILVSRAGVVDFDAMLDAAESKHIFVATDVFPEEPLARNHRARTIDNILLSPHQAGAMVSALKEIGKRTVGDCEMIVQGFPPILCKLAQPETVVLSRSKPVSKS
jgi:phosphoglycerate dehydrogenase-like enzyme